MNDEIYKKFADLVRHPQWDNFMVFVDKKRVECIERLEECPPESLRKIQGELSVIKMLLTLRGDVLKIMDGR